MTKQEQNNVNDLCLGVYNEAMEEYNSNKYNWHESRLRTCNATVIYTDNYILLKSYSTIVAILERHTGFVFDVLRKVYGYTVTSSQHISKFKSDHPHTKVYTAR